jgi:imidazolonepropionase-like amidohydrolase
LPVDTVVALVGARLVDGTGGPAQGDATVVLDHGRIRAVGGSRAAPGGARVIELDGAWLTPGVIDTHVHLGLAGRSGPVFSALQGRSGPVLSALQGRSGPGLIVRRGVTAVRDLGWPPERLGPLVAEAWSVGLLVHVVGPILTAPGGYPTRAAWAPAGTAREIGSVDQAVRAVDAVMAGGACAAKVGLDDRSGPLLDVRTLGALVERAAEWGRPVTAHVGSADALELALDAGVAELAHVPFSPSPVPDHLVHRAVEAGVRLVPTLHCRDADPCGPRVAASGFLRRWVAAGGSVVYGTDLGNACTQPGVDGRELALLSAAGMAPGSVVVAATSAAAHAIGAGELTGRVAPGLRADLLVLDADPLTDPVALARPRWVIAGGRPVAW